MSLSFPTTLTIISIILLLTTLSPDYLLPLPHLPHPQQFTQWKLQHHKTYNQHQQLFRLIIYTKNKLQMEEHNKQAEKGLHTWLMGINKFSDLTQEEFVDIYLAKQEKQSSQNITLPDYYSCNAILPPNQTVPDSYDWFAKCTYLYHIPAAVTSIKDHGTCMSPSYAISSIDTIQSVKYIMSGKLLTLSSQQVIDCTGTQYGNNGCISGNVTGTFNYLHRNGVTSEKKYPYVGFHQNCHYNISQKEVQVLGCFMLASNKQEDIKRAIFNQPFVASINAQKLKTYASGIFQTKYSLPCKTIPNHWMELIGYGNDPSSKLNYWKLKNSWGSGWGQQGFLYIVRKGDGPGLCGVQAQLYTPIV